MELAGSPGSSLPALVLTLDSGVICNGERTLRRSFPSVSAEVQRAMDWACLIWGCSQYHLTRARADRCSQIPIQGPRRGRLNLALLDLRGSWDTPRNWLLSGHQGQSAARYYGYSSATAATNAFTIA